MSTLAYAALTQQRDSAQPGSSTSTEPPGIRTWIDAFAALVPAEILAAHATLIGAMTKVEEVSGQRHTIITDPITLKYVFYALCGLAVVLYIAGRLSSKHWDKWDYVRMLIPALAFVGWTMAQRSTAFDAACPAMEPAARTATAVIGAIALGLLASALAFKADQKTPS